MTDQATFQLQPIDGGTLILAAGEIDIANIDQFKAFVMEAAAGDNGSMVVSLEKVSYADSHTIEALVTLSKRMSKNRRRLVVVAPAGTPAGRILRIAGLDAALALFESLDDARVSIAGRA